MVSKTREIVDQKKLPKVLPFRQIEHAKHLYYTLTNSRCNHGESFVKAGDYVTIGQVIGKRYGSFFEQNIHATVSGVVVGMTKKYHRTGMLVDCIEVENDFKETLSPTIVDRSEEEIAKLTKEDITEIIKESALVGLGGSSFPTYIKFQTNDPIHTICINGVECEPYLTADYQLMTNHAKEMMIGIGYALQAFQAKRAVISIKKKYRDLYLHLMEVKAEVPHLPIELSLVGNYYPQGYEKEMIKTALGVKIPYGTIPTRYGIVVFNVSTAYGIYQAVKHNFPITERYFTITGDGIKEPSNCVVKLGTSISHVIACCGGFVGSETKELIIGGPMMGENSIHLDLVTTKACTAILVMNKAEHVEEPCIRCSSCVYSCPANLQPVQIYLAVKRNDVKAVKDLKIADCILCGLCGYTCTSKINLTEYMRIAKKME